MMIPRHAARPVETALEDTRVVVVNGARQSGKSTLVRSVLAGRETVERRLDRPAERAEAVSDPDAIARLAATGALVAVDEVQRAPDLILSIKAQVDEDQRPGQFILTGSARLLGLRAIPDALVGRAETIELWPFSQAELAGTEAPIVDRLFCDDPSPDSYQYVAPEQELEHGGPIVDNLVDRIVRGGFPEAVKRREDRRARFFESYTSDLVDRDVTQVAELRRRGDVLALLRRLAAAQAQLFARSTISSDVGLPATTLDRYIAALEEVFLLKLVPAWTSGATPRATRQPKIVFVDSGLAAYLAGATSRRFRRDPSRLGPHLEAFAISELLRLAPLSDVRPTVHHYRTRDGVEVDALLEARDGRIVAIEVKASSTVRSDDARHLVHLRERLGDRFAAGVVLHGGSAAVSLGDRILALPIDALWSATPC